MERLQEMGWFAHELCMLICDFFWAHWDLPSGKRLHMENHHSQKFGKSTINDHVPVSKLLVITRGYIHYISIVYPTYPIKPH